MSMSGNKAFTESFTDVSSFILQTALQHISSGVYFLEIDSAVFYKRIIVR
jgi:hypothetical protein